MRQVNTTNLMMMAALAGTIGTAGSAVAQTLSWLNAAGGSIGSAANWNPAQVPGAGNTLLFNLAASYPLTYPAGVATTAAQTFVRGTQTLTINAPHTTGLVTIGNTNASTGTVTLTTGTLNAGDVLLGTAFGSAGVLNVNDDDALLDCSQLSVADNTNQICTVNVTNSGRIEASSVVIGDDNPVGEGRVTVSGRTQVFPPLLSTLTTSGSMVVGRDGIGTLNVASGAFVDVGTTMTVGQNVSAGPILSEGTVTVGGTGLGFPAALAVGSTLRIGRGTLASTDTGDGSVEVNSGGAVTVNGPTTVGGSGLGSGVLTVNTGGRFTAAGLSFGTSGDFQHAGGIVTVNGGGFTHDEPTLIVSGAADTSLVLDGLTTAANFAVAAADDAIRIGDSAAGSLTLRNGTGVNVTQGFIRLGNGAGSTGSLVIESGASLTADGIGEVFVGDEGAGTLSVRSGGSLICEDIFVSFFAGAGTVLIENSGTTVQSGATNVRDGGVLTIRDGAVVSFDGLFGNQVSVQVGATLNIDHATLNATADVDIDGSFTMTNGVINAQEFKRTVPVSASGTINAQVPLGPTITANGDLVLGDDSDLGFNSADLAVGPHRVQLRDSDVAVLRGTTIAGGQLSTTSSFRIPAGNSLSGTGTFNGDLSNSGSITATTAAGLTFNGVVSGLGQGIGGTKVTFGSGGGFTGTGIITSKIQNNPGAQITITAPSLIGDSSTTGYTGGGVLDITGGLTINDSNGINLGSLVVLRGADLACDSTMNLTTGGRIIGHGRLLGTLNNSGSISPGLPEGDVTNEVQVLGPYVQRIGGTAGELVFDLEGPDPDQCDLLYTVPHPATLDGTFRLRVLNGFRPANGFRRVILRSQALTNELDTIVMPPRFTLITTQANLVLLYCSADFNSDGFVDFFDYDSYVECFETAVCPPGVSADFNEDGFTDFFDYDEFVLAFEEGC